MKICFPVEIDKGLDSIVCEHFGHVPAYVLVDTDTLDVSTVDNVNQGQQFALF